MKRLSHWVVTFLLFALPVPILAYSTNMNASFVVGQPNLTSNLPNQGGSPAANTLKYHYTPLVANGKLIIPDYSNSRVLIYNSIPTTNNANADVVIGQVDMTHNLADQGGAVAANVLDFPTSVTTDGTKLIVCDYANHRVLIYNTIPTSNNASANVVIGQTNMSSNSSNTTQSTLFFPNDVFYDSATGKLVIADAANERVLIYNSIPTSNGQPADLVLGQADFTSNSTNRGGSANANTMASPYIVRIYNGKLLVADASNNRVLIWNSIPTTNGQAADVVLGQPNFTTRTSYSGAQIAANTMPFPSGIAYNNTELFIYTEARILVFTGIPTTNNPNAVKVLGQSTFTSATDNQGGAVGPNTLSNTDGGVFATSNQLFVADNSNFRTLIFNDDATPTPTPTLSAPTPRPTTAPGTGSSYVPNPNKHDNWSAEVNAGAQFMGEIRPLWNVEAPDASVLIQNTAVHDPLNIHISILDPFELKILPWHNGLATYGRIYSMKAISAFNGFPIYSSDEPFTVTIPYDPMLLKGSSPTQLRIAYFDRATQKWKVLKMNTVLNREAHTIANTTKQFTYFVVVR